MGETKENKDIRRNTIIKTLMWVYKNNPSREEIEYMLKNIENDLRITDLSRFN